VVDTPQFFPTIPVYRSTDICRLAGASTMLPAPLHSWITETQIQRKMQIDLPQLA